MFIHHFNEPCTLIPMEDWTYSWLINSNVYSGVLIMNQGYFDVIHRFHWNYNSFCGMLSMEQLFKNLLQVVVSGRSQPYSETLE